MSKLPKKLFVQRDVSWMYFNRRILLEARRDDVPLMERLSFLGIYANNLDEFFSVRVASLRRIIESDTKKEKKKIAEETLKDIYQINSTLSVLSQETMRELLHELKKEHIYIIDETELTKEQESQVLDYFLHELSNSLNPVYLDNIKVNDTYFDQSVHLAVQMFRDDEHFDIAIIRVPSRKHPRFVRLPDGDDGKVYVMFIEDVIRFCMPYLFIGCDYKSYKAYSFKFTRDSEMELDPNSPENILTKVSKGLKRRRAGDMIRIVYDRAMPTTIYKELFRKADLDEHDMPVPETRYINMKDFIAFPTCGRQDLKFPPQPPLVGHKLVDHKNSLIEKIKEKDYMLHFPYQSFDLFVRLLREAAISDQVKEIKVTFYRVAKDSSVVNALTAAARNGKKVTAVIEVLARFDEANNIEWSKEMSDAGVKVIHGPDNLKIHTKLLYMKLEKGGIACIGTGNMHDGNARVYTDLMLMTHDAELVNEAANVFRFIEFPFMPTNFKHLLVSPNSMRTRFYALINNEIKNCKSGLPSFIRIKVNHITDEGIIAKLYEASAAGVPIELFVRGNCSLVPGVKKYSENIKMNGIIDRYLEHSRIFIFCNNNDPKYFFGSADWMERNLDRRIEVITPIYAPLFKQELKMMLDYGMKDI